MLLRCARCISKFAHDLLHCPQCGEPAENSAPDPDVVGENPAAEAVADVAPAPKKSRAKATAAAVQDPPAAEAPSEDAPQAPAEDAAEPAPEAAPDATG
jgi:hypothetical protein